MKTHIRIEKPKPSEPGAFRVVRDDRIIAVDADGCEVDISRCVTGWREIAEVGEARRLEITVLGFTEVEVERQATP